MAGRLRTVGITAAITLAAALALSHLGTETAPVGTSLAAPPGNPLDEIIQARGLTPDEAEAALKTFVPPGQVRRVRDGHLGRPSRHRSCSTASRRCACSRRSRSTPRTPGRAGARARRVRRTMLEEGLLRRRPADADLGRPPPSADLAHQRQVRRRVGHRHRQERRPRRRSSRCATSRPRASSRSPTSSSDHHGLFTDNSEYIVVSTLLPDALQRAQGLRADRGLQGEVPGHRELPASSTAKAGRIVPAESFQIELPPYFQDLSIAGPRAVRRALLHQLDEHRDGDRRRPREASRRWRSARRSARWTTCTSSTGRRPTQVAKDADQGRRS